MKREYTNFLTIILCAFPLACAQGVGNPAPGSPQDTLNLYLKKAASGAVDCSATDHAAFIRYDDATGTLLPTKILVSMVDWEQKDNDGDGVFDEDFPNGLDDDSDGKIDEDGVEPGAVTKFVDCDGLDNEIVLQVRDSEPGRGVVSTQEWFVRVSGKPERDFAFWTNADQVNCAIEKDPDGLPLSGDEIMECSYDDVVWVGLGRVDFSDYDGNCLKRMKFGREDEDGTLEKRPYCDLTREFEVDIDRNNDGVIDPHAREQDQALFSVSCVDVPETVVDESVSCPLGRMIWDSDGESATPRAQLFIGHTGFAYMRGERVTKREAR